MSITIYGIPASRAIRPLWAATELGLDFTHVNLDYQGGGTRQPDFLAINPNGHIPVVVDQRPAEQGGEIVVWESMACALYLARHHGNADGQGIAPSGPAEDAEALRWSFWAVTEVESDALTVLMHRMVMPAERRKPALAEAAERRLVGPLGVLERHLQRQSLNGASFLAASRFTVADLCAVSVLNWARPAKALMASHPLTHDWIQRCIDRRAHVAVKSMRPRI
jgi:glutathione S-transferase